MRPERLADTDEQCQLTTEVGVGVGHVARRAWSLQGHEMGSSERVPSSAWPPRAVVVVFRAAGGAPILQQSKVKVGRGCRAVQAADLRQHRALCAHERQPLSATACPAGVPGLPILQAGAVPQEAAQDRQRGKRGDDATAGALHNLPAAGPRPTATKAKPLFCYMTSAFVRSSSTCGRPSSPAWTTTWRCWCRCPGPGGGGRP